jgi:hypothetical protein
LWANNCWSSCYERADVVVGIPNIGPPEDMSFFRFQRANAVEIKSWITSACEFFVNTSVDLDVWFSNTNRTDFPYWTVTGMIDHLSLATNFFDYTPWRQLNQSEYGWDNIRACIRLLEKTSIEGVWSETEYSGSTNSGYFSYSTENTCNGVTSSDSDSTSAGTQNPDLTTSVNPIVNSIGVSYSASKRVASHVAGGNASAYIYNLDCVTVRDTCTVSWARSRTDVSWVANHSYSDGLAYISNSLTTNVSAECELYVKKSQSAGTDDPAYKSYSTSDDSGCLVAGCCSGYAECRYASADRFLDGYIATYPTSVGTKNTYIKQTAIASKIKSSDSVTFSSSITFNIPTHLVSFGTDTDSDTVNASGTINNPDGSTCKSEWELSGSVHGNLTYEVADRSYLVSRPLILFDWGFDYD